MATGRIGVTPTLRTRWSKAPAGGTTSLSGLDDNSVSLVYDVGYEGVYRNGVLLSRGNDYTATDGTTVTLIDATITGDIIEIFANELIPLSDAISKGQYTAKGALLSATAASTPGVLTVGSNDQVLTADSTTATGLKWATPASGSTFVGCSLRASSGSTQSIANNTLVAINFNAEDFDTDGFHDNSTNNTRITIPAGKGGYYQVNALTRWATNSSGFRGLYIYKNGSVFSPQYAYFIAGSSQDATPTFSSIIYLVATDYIEMYVEQSSGGSLTNYTDNNRFSVGYLGA